MVSKMLTILVVYWKRVQGARERQKNAYAAACPITSILPGRRITPLAQSSLPGPPHRYPLDWSLHRVKEEGYVYLLIISAESVLLLTETVGVRNLLPNHPDGQESHGWWFKWLIPGHRRRDEVLGVTSNFGSCGWKKARRWWQKGSKIYGRSKRRKRGICLSHHFVVPGSWVWAPHRIGLPAQGGLLLPLRLPLFLFPLIVLSCTFCQISQ